MKYLDAWLRQPEWMMHPMQRFAREHDAVDYEELRAWNVLPGREVEYELFYVEADRDPYESQLSAVDSVRWYDLTPLSEAAFYVYVCQETREADQEWREALLALELLVVPPVIFDDRGRMGVTVVGESGDIQSMLDGLPGEIDVSVRTIGEYDHRRGRVASDLTDRQREAVAAATDLGFYEVPRSASVEAVAAELDCAPSTASTLLRKAESKVMRRVTDRRNR